MPGPTRERGFALLIVLWAVVLLALLATQLAATGRTEVQLASNLRAAAVAEAAADGAVQAAAFHLLDPANPWAADGTDRTLPVPGGAVAIRIENEAGKVNPNLADADLLRALLLRVGAEGQAAGTLAAAIVDWRTPATPQRTLAAKAAAYGASGLAYGPPGAPFADLEELGAVLGMTPALLARLAPYASVLTDAEPDYAVAAPPVRQALRDVSGQARGAPPLPLRTVTVTALAQASGGRFTRRATLRLGAGAKEAPVVILAWEAAPG